MLRSILSILGTLGSLALYLIIGGTIIAGFYNPNFFLIPGSLILLAGAVTLADKLIADRRLRIAREEYDEIQRKHPYDAREHCPHKIFQISQTDYVVFIATNKWCKVCGKDLGPAKLKKSIFGNRWE